ncbi:Histidine kinase [Duganella sp. CF458]|uniref:sensor histidine kinase n=1 Tax=Duganella sp. CF458 TaxID=1884368 RepID=UPI0008E49C1A|nr:histidine kinase [Duganella sp. CF458]SFF60244.1 Histidine kinase [Duganella sp. CF458]
MPINSTTPADQLPRSLPTLRQAGVALFIALQLSWGLTALFSTAFLPVFSRIGFIGALFLFAFYATARRHAALRLLSIVLLAPIASMVTFIVAEWPNAGKYLEKVEGAGAFVVLTLVSWICGLASAAFALRFERKAREKAERARTASEKDSLERSLLDARLRLLQAQIEPHFLFNTLANIQALVETGSPNAAPVLRHLINYLRAAGPHLADADATLGKELQLVEAYLSLMRMRMPDRLEYTLSVAPELAGLRFPAMALLTLVENAIRHGIDPTTEGGRIDVGARCDHASGAVNVWVADTGVGMSESATPGAGLANVRTRLRATYGDTSRLDLHEVAPHGLRAECHFTVRETECSPSLP